MIVEIVFTFCLASSSADCRHERQQFEGSLLACSAFGQAEALPWLGSHPKWRLRRYRCGMVDVAKRTSEI